MLLTYQVLWPHLRMHFEHILRVAPMCTGQQGGGYPGQQGGGYPGAPGGQNQGQGGYPGAPGQGQGGGYPGQQQGGYPGSQQVLGLNPWAGALACCRVQESGPADRPPSEPVLNLEWCRTWRLQFVLCLRHTSSEDRDSWTMPSGQMLDLELCGFAVADSSEKGAY